MTFLYNIGIELDYVTIHPDKLLEWSSYYSEYDILIKEDSECIWSDGSIGGYCTEFYVNDIEIGNIVNTMDTCIDIGFGLERLLLVKGQFESKSRLQILEETALIMIDNGIEVSHNKRGHILRKIITECVLDGSKLNIESFNSIRDNQIRIYRNYCNLSTRRSNRNKDDSYWLSTIGFNKRIEHKYLKLIEDITHEKETN